jgi:hypothetical protein
MLEQFISYPGTINIRGLRLLASVKCLACLANLEEPDSLPFRSLCTELHDVRFLDEAQDMEQALASHV